MYCCIGIILEKSTLVDRTRCTYQENERSVLKRNEPFKLKIRCILLLKAILESTSQKPDRDVAYIILKLFKNCSRAKINECIVVKF